MPRPSSISTRSGRFVTQKQANPSDPGDTIIAAGAADRIYRFHNTARNGKLKFTVGAAGATDLDAGGSIDLHVPSGQAVSVGKGPGTPGKGKGVYDLLTEGAVVRSGAFKGSVTIAKLGAQTKLYRVINASEKEIAVTGVTIAPESSADVVLTGDVSVSGLSPEGVFDLLGND